MESPHPPISRQPVPRQPVPRQPVPRQPVPRQPVPRQPIIEVIDPEMAAVIRAKTGAERLQIANAMFVAARRMIVSQLRAEHPDWDQQRIGDTAARRLAHRTR